MSGQGGADNPPLGIYGKFAAARAGNPLSISRFERFRLQVVARSLLPGWSVCNCLRVPIGELHGSGAVSVHRTESDAWYSGLQTCQSLWVCPVCSAKISELRRGELLSALEAVKAAGLGVLMVTYTFSHERSQRLDEVKGALLAAHRGMSGNRPYKRLAERVGVAGTIKALEVKFGTRNGWHPHLHVVWVTESPLSDSEISRLESELYGIWSASARRKGLSMNQHGLSVERAYTGVEAYISKFGHEPADTSNPWGVDSELAKQHSKRQPGGAARVGRYTPFDLLRHVQYEGRDWAARRFREYARSSKGDRQLRWSPGLRARLGVADAGDVVEVDASDTFFASLFAEEWYAVRWADARREVLEAARVGDLEAFRGLIAELYARYWIEYLAA